MRPRFLVDCDGVASNFVAGALANLREIDGSTWQHDDVTDWDFKRQLESLTAEQQAAFWKSFCRKGFCADLEPYPGAVEAIGALREVADVYFVTADWDESEFWLHERKEWLRRHFGAGKRNRVFAYDKFVVRGDALVDDKTSHVVEWQKHNPNGMGILFGQPYNADASIGRWQWPEIVHAAGNWGLP